MERPLSVSLVTPPKKYQIKKNKKIQNIIKKISILKIPNTTAPTTMPLQPASHNPIFLLAAVLLVKLDELKRGPTFLS
jgi:hypothetical protein